MQKMDKLLPNCSTGTNSSSFQRFTRCIFIRMYLQEKEYIYNEYETPQKHNRPRSLFKFASQLNRIMQ